MLAFEFHYLFHWYVQLNQEKNFKSKIPYLIDTFIRVRRDLQQYDLDLFAATTVRSMDIGTPKVGKEGVALNVGENAASHFTNQHVAGSSTVDVFSKISIESLHSYQSYLFT